MEIASGFVQLLGERIPLEQPDAMFARHRATHSQGHLQDLIKRGKSPGRSLGIAARRNDCRMEIAIAGMSERANQNVVSQCDRLDLGYRLSQSVARDRDIVEQPVAQIGRAHV